ncbi:MAG TPA: 5-carboxymethyl-2-hydroxymuconate Delta-isomerase [Gammaproteobacteria bacterium]|jgi:5-carboxymethyl-2-hydroxymuconate isomerase
MPHLIIEYSEGVDGTVAIPDIVDAAHAGAMSSELFPEYDIKTRAIGYRDHRTGATRDSFVHVTVRLLDGRSDAQKAMLSEAVLAHIEPLLPGVNSVGVEIVDMHRASYRKRVLDG